MNDKYQNIQTNALDAQTYRGQHLILLQFRNQQNRRKSIAVINELLILKTQKIKSKPLNYSICDLFSELVISWKSVFFICRFDLSCFNFSFKGRSYKWALNFHINCIKISCSFGIIDVNQKQNRKLKKWVQYLYPQKMQSMHMISEDEICECLKCIQCACLHGDMHSRVWARVSLGKSIWWSSWSAL